MIVDAPPSAAFLRWVQSVNHFHHFTGQRLRDSTGLGMTTRPPWRSQGIDVVNLA